MSNLSFLEECYKKFALDLRSWLPEGITEVDLNFLFEFDLLSFKEEPIDSQLTRYFHVIETDEKITLINNEFVVWIVPVQDVEKSLSSTYIMIALNQSKGPKLELAFFTSGVYNSSRLVLRILEKFLREVQETEAWASKITSGLDQSL